MILLDTLKILMNMKNFEIFYHGSPRLFAEFDLSHVLEGDGKVKFGYGVYVTSSYKSAAHYSTCDDSAAANYVYTVEIPALRGDNHIAFKQPVCEAVLQRTETALGQSVPEKVSGDGKEFRKWLAKTLGGKVDLAGEKAAAEFLDSIGVDYVIWPYNWKNPALGTNRAVFNAAKVRIVKVDRVSLDQKKQLVEGSEVQVR